MGKHDPIAHDQQPEMPPHEFVDDGRTALDYPGASSGRAVCSWDEDGEGACDRPRTDPIHRP